MMRIKIFGLLLLSFCCSANAQPVKKALFIIVDGIPADVLQRVPHPNLQAIAKVGGYTKAYVGGKKGDYSQTPTISAVGYNSLLTGTWVNKHNVWGNDIKAPNYHYPTVFRLFKQQYPYKTIGIFSTWTDNRTKLAGEVLSQTDNLKVDYKADGYELDTVTYPHDDKSRYIHRIDERVADEAAKCVREKAPDLSWVYLEYTDDMGHLYGDSRQQDSAVRYMDAQVGRIMNAINYRKKNFKEDWQVFITTDHGRDSITGRNHGGQSTRERTTWIVTNAQGLNNYFKTGQPAITDIMPTLLRHLSIVIDTATAFELDGTPLTGPVSFTKLHAAMEKDSLAIYWQPEPVAKKQTAKIWFTTTNGFKTGTKDKYRVLTAVTLASGVYKVSRRQIPASFFYKIVLQAPGNTANYWVEIPPELVFPG